MENLLMGHGICKNHSISGGNNGIAAVTVDITVCLLGKWREKKLVTSLSSIMGNGHSAVFTEFRLLHNFLGHFFSVNVITCQADLVTYLLCLFKCCSCFQEPVAVALSALNLSIQFHGWMSFFILLYYKLPLRPDKKTYYEYTGLWHIYGILAMNSWFWSAVFHSR